MNKSIVLSVVLMLMMPMLMAIRQSGSIDQENIDAAQMAAATTAAEQPDVRYTRVRHDGGARVVVPVTVLSSLAAARASCATPAPRLRPLTPARPPVRTLQDLQQVIVENFEALRDDLADRIEKVSASSEKQ